MENYYEGYEFPNESFYDDLESMFEQIRLGNEPTKSSSTYFLPMLTEKEMKLVEIKDSSYKKNFIFDIHADVNTVGMEVSEPNSKFVLGKCSRQTFTIENQLSENNFNCFSCK